MTSQQRQIVREALILANPWTWGCVALAASIWLPVAITRALRNSEDAD